MWTAGRIEVTVFGAIVAILFAAGVVLMYRSDALERASAGSLMIVRVATAVFRLILIVVGGAIGIFAVNRFVGFRTPLF
jgi:hypothetical protein